MRKATGVAVSKANEGGAKRRLEKLKSQFAGVRAIGCLLGPDPIAIAKILSAMPTAERTLMGSA